MDIISTLVSLDFFDRKDIILSNELSALLSILADHNTAIASLDVEFYAVDGIRPYKGIVYESNSFAFFPREIGIQLFIKANRHWVYIGSTHLTLQPPAIPKTSIQQINIEHMNVNPSTRIQIKKLSTTSEILNAYNNDTIVKSHRVTDRSILQAIVALPSVCHIVCKGTKDLDSIRNIAVMNGLNYIPTATITDVACLNVHFRRLIKSAKLVDTYKFSIAHLPNTLVKELESLCTNLTAHQPTSDAFMTIVVSLYFHFMLSKSLQQIKN